MPWGAAHLLQCGAGLNGLALVNDKSQLTRPSQFARGALSTWPPGRSPLCHSCLWDLGQVTSVSGPHPLDGPVEGQGYVTQCAYGTPSSPPSCPHFSAETPKVEYRLLASWSHYWLTVPGHTSGAAPDTRPGGASCRAVPGGGTVPGRGRGDDDGGRGLKEGGAWAWRWGGDSGTRVQPRVLGAAGRWRCGVS